RLENKVALISGGARGMGAAEARMFAREGAKVVIGDVLEAEGRQVEAQINEAGGECVFVLLDVTQESQWQQAVETAVARFGKLDVLVNNAGIVLRGILEDTSAEDWDKVMDVNAKGVFLGTRAAISEMKKSGGGSIVNISSISGIVGQSDIQPVYNASKGAVRIFTKSAAIQYAKEGIRVNSVHPGSIDTPMAGDRLNDPGLQRQANERTPLGRTAHPDEVAYGVLFLASDESSFMTGSELVIDGGATAQ
ncbi:MAG TPA: glucose 1-dehydrogenase, partial [Dehalococcoidia bacterium]|nr:glucose 1-dehydrogenase [Dehalococcoidia bacterium]